MSKQSALQKEFFASAPTPVPSALERLQTLLEADLDGVNHIILKKLQSSVPLVPEIAGYLIQAGGKRLRPLLTLACARLVGYRGTRQRDLAACVEFIHTATLLHDDVVDESTLRRGRASANALWDNQACVLVGDFLFSRAFELMVQDGSLEVLGILSKASSIIAEGEVLQLQTNNNLATTEAEYFDVIKSKTAQLFSAACQIGPVLAERPESEKEAFRQYGMNLGIVFQLIDDILDYDADQAHLGKTVGDDFREGKMTLPVLLAYAEGGDEEQAFWKRTLGDLEQTEKDFQHAMYLLNQHQIFNKARAMTHTFAEHAISALAPFPETQEKEILKEIVGYCYDRLS